MLLSQYSETTARNIRPAAVCFAPHLCPQAVERSSMRLSRWLFGASQLRCCCGAHTGEADLVRHSAGESVTRWQRAANVGRGNNVGRVTRRAVGNRNTPLK